MATSQCLKTGDCFLLLDLPAKLTIGLDTLALTAEGKNFLGFRDIPAGPHFLWLSEQGAISRCGYWFVTVQQGQARIKKWDRYNEILGDAADDQEQRASIEQIYPKLMPHNYKGEEKDTQTAPRVAKQIFPPDPDFAKDSLTIWTKLTSAITPNFLNRVTGETNTQEWLLDTTDGATGAHPLLQSNQSSPANSQLHFLFQQDIIDLQLLSRRDATQSDTTSRILAVLNNHTATEADILAEFQFTFLTGLYLSNYPCLEQWWHLLLKIILQAHGLVFQRPELVRDLLQAFHAQLVYNERYVDFAGDEKEAETCASVLDTIPRNKARLRRALAVYKRRLEGDLAGNKGGELTEQQREIGKAFGQLEGWFWRYGWDLKEEDVEESRRDVEGTGEKSKEDRVREARERMMIGGGDDSDEETGEYAPVFVELDEQGREVGRIDLHGQ